MSKLQGRSGLQPGGGESGYNERMKAWVHVGLKKTVLDPQGQTICRALVSMGYDEIREVRQGKYFEIELAPGIDSGQARAQIEKLAGEVLTNPVIEDFNYRLEE